jgi:hypothetical protein
MGSEAKHPYLSIAPSTSNDPSRLSSKGKLTETGDSGSVKRSIWDLISPRSAIDSSFGAETLCHV